MRNKFVLLSSAFAGAVLFGCSTAAFASSLTVNQAFHFLDRRSSNSINLSAGLYQTFGAEASAQDGNDAATTATATQGTVTNLPLFYEPFDTLPHHFVRSRPADISPNGQWTLNFTNGADTKTIMTPGIGTSPSPMPFVTGMSISGGGASPTLSWSAPGGLFDAQRLIIRDTTDLIGSGGVGGGGVANIIYSQDIGAGATSFVINPADTNFTQPLQYGKLYAIELLVRDLRNDAGPNNLVNTLSQSRSFFDFTLLAPDAPANVYVPTVNTANTGGTTYEFRQVPVTTGETVYIDPLVAVGYDYQIGAGDPNFASVTMPTGIGDDIFQLLLWDGSDYQFAATINGGDTYTFDTGGVDRFRILGIETSALLDPNSSTAFITGLTFVSSGSFSGTMTPLTEFTTPIPATLPLFATGLGGLGYLSWRRRKRSAKPAA
jgi:hypothetical protein